MHLSLHIGLLDIQLTSHWTVGHSINQPSDCWTQHCPNIGYFDKKIPTIVLPLSCLTQHCLNISITSCPKIGQQDRLRVFLIPNCPTEDNLSNIFVSAYSHFLYPWCSDDRLNSTQNTKQKLILSCLSLRYSSLLKTNLTIAYLY